MLATRTFSSRSICWLREKLRGAQRNPLFRRRARQIILRQIGAIDGRGAVGAEQRELADVALMPQRLGRRQARGAATNDHDTGQAATHRHGIDALLGLAEHEQAVTPPLDIPASDRVERRCGQGLAGTQAEAGVMPRTAHGVPDQQALGERAAVVRARRTDREHFIAAPSQQHRFALGVAQQHLAVFQVGGRNSVTQAWSRKLGRSAHGWRRLHPFSPDVAGSILPRLASWLRALPGVAHTSRSTKICLSPLRSCRGRASEIS